VIFGFFFWDLIGKWWVQNYFRKWNPGASECFVLSIEKDRQAAKHAENLRNEELRLANARTKKAEMEQKTAGEQFRRTC